MSSNAAEELGVHDRLIREAFIDPIRTVVVVDDEYPTLDSLIAKEQGETSNWSQKKQENITRVRDILDFARNKDRAWLVDIHDAKDVSSESEKVVASHLHHSDLMVLDYHLQGDDAGGDAAIDILRELAEGNHFNLVIVHTKGYDGGLDRVIREIALGLTYPDSVQSLSTEESEQLDTAIAQWEIEDDEIVSKMGAEISEDVYLELRTRHPENFEKLYSLPVGERIRELLKGKPSSIKVDLKQLAKWLVSKKQGQLKKQFTARNLGNVQVGSAEGINWIRTERLFVTVLSKTCTPDEFENKLLDAIKASFPSPHRLLLTKMRVEIDERGLSAEASILGNRYLQTEWLDEFLNPSPIDTKAVIHTTVSRHWEALGDQLHLSLDAFTKQLQEHFSALSKDEVVAKCGLNKSDIGSAEALKRFNCFASTKPFDRSHLTTGHVFRMSHIEEGDVQFWICLSPACDMVPGRGESPGFNDNAPFIAVRLHKINDDRPLKHAAKNIFLFIEVNHEIETFSIHEDGIAQNPDWQQMFAGNKAIFHDENKLSLCSIVEEDDRPALRWTEASVVAQLRSEYALNFLQRIGALLSRPGLGMNFKSRPDKK